LRYRQVMAHWDAVLPAARLHDIEYEQLVRDPEQTLGRLFEYLGLAWEPACLDFHTTQRAVKTASVAQVRQPLYATAVDLWQNYSEELAPCAAQLGLP
ncbi:MAG: sulfotransferase, partial [Gammaproteobacteria bacterium]|nr:sulfotransferase [Gammaproteobacteria bacterium]